MYVCKTKHHTSTKPHSKKHVNKKHTDKNITTTTRKHHSSKPHSTKKKSVTKKAATIKKSNSKKSTTTKKSAPKKVTTTSKKVTSKSNSKKSTTKKTTTTTKKTTTTTTTTTTTHKPTTTPAHKFRVTTTDPIVVPTALPTEVNEGNNDEPTLPSTPSTPSAAAVADALPSTPVDNNNQVNSQSVNPEKDSNAQPQSKVIGVSIGAVVGCIAAAGLAGMFIYRRREKNSQDIEDLNQTSEVNTRWRTQSFMAVVAGAVAKLPKRSNSTASTNSRPSFNVLGSIRRAASNASRSLSVRSNGSRSSVQSYGIAVSGPIPAIARIDGDQAQYYGEPSSPTSTGVHHTHAY